jgi:Ca2+-binding RTX toxin-like protein
VTVDGRANDGEAGEGDNVIGAEAIIGGSGDDVLVGPSRLAATLEGGPGDDRLTGGRENDLLAGGPGNDTLVGGPGADWFLGGPGVDSFACGPGKDQVGDHRRGETATGCEEFAPLPSRVRR